MEHDNHQLKSSNETTLEGIEQLPDRSQLTTLYPRAKRQWSGDLLSSEERDTKRSAHLEEISRSIRKHFFSIGFLIPLPIFLSVLFIVVGQQFITNDKKAVLFILPFIIIFGLIAWLAIVSLKKVRKIFYDHSIAIGPFYLTLILLLLPAGVASYLLTMVLHSSQTIPATAIVGVIEIVLSVVFTFFLLFIWTTPKLSGRSKMSLILAFGGLLVVTAATCAAVHLAHHL